MVKKGDFNQPTYADLRLVLWSSQGGSSTSTPTSTSSDPVRSAPGSPTAKLHCERLPLDDDVRSFYAHKVILASNSPVINAMLLRAKEQRELPAMGDGLSICLVPVECSGSVVRLLVSPPARQQTADVQLETLELPLEQEELLAGEVLFRSIYSDDLAEEVRCAMSGEQGAGVNRATLLVQVYRLADRLEVCTDQCAQAISALRPADCDSVDVVNYVFSLKTSAPALAEHATIKVLLEKCVSQLVKRIGGLTSFFIPENMYSKWKEFQKLDFLPVLAFFDSYELEVTSENEVLTLMGLWMGDNRDNQISKDQLRAFWNVLRLGLLTTSFISRLSALAPWLPVDPAVLADVAAWKSCLVTFPRKAASMQERLQSVHGRGVAWFSMYTREDYDYVYLLDSYFPKESLAKLLTSVQHSGEQEGQPAARVTLTSNTFNGYDFVPTLSVQLVSDGSEKMFVVSVGFEFRTSAFISKGSRHFVRIKATCRLGKGRVPLADIDGFLYGTHSWEVARVDTLDDFSCLGSYLNEDGNLPVELSFDELD